MKIEINTEAELDIEAIADELNSHIENKIEEYIDCALDNYDFRDIVREEVNDMDLSYEIDSAIDGKDDLVRNDDIGELENRIEEIETALSGVSSVLPNKALDASMKANEQLTKMYEELVEKCKHFIGVTEPKENTESSDQ
tara:strand:+ start:118 stop:537 length:420 start_codon:yes stop_codon:yes gene_type:complete